MTLHELRRSYQQEYRVQLPRILTRGSKRTATDVAKRLGEVAPGSLFVCKGASFSPAYLTSAVEARLRTFASSRSRGVAGSGANEAAICVDDVR